MHDALCDLTLLIRIEPVRKFAFLVRRRVPQTFARDKIHGLKFPQRAH